MARTSGPESGDLPQCLVFLPHSYAGRGPAESCVRLLDAFGAAGVDVRLHVIRTRKPAAPGVKVVQAMGPLGQRLPFSMIREAGLRKVAAKFRKALDAAPAGSIAWFWPDVPDDLVRHARSRGIITVREMINSPLAHAKPILDRAYAAAGFATGHAISDAAVARESAELQLHDYLFASNPEVEKALLALGIAPERILTTTFGWTKTRFAGMAPRVPDASRPPRFCFVGTMNVRKGVPELLAAWAKAGIDGELRMAGGVEPCLAPLVEAAVASGTVHHFGHIDNVGEFYRECDVFVFPTHEEGGPQVGYEAASFGLPLIVTPMGAGRLVENGVTGLIVEPGDVDALATALRRMADDAAFRESCATAARVAADRFEYDVVGRERIGLLRQVARLRL